MKLKIQYYALLREEAGRPQETLETASRTPADLYRELSALHGFSLKAPSLRAAVNDEFVPFDAVLKEGDTVVFIPPVSGG